VAARSDVAVLNADSPDAVSLSPVDSPVGVKFTFYF
jgi:hypothetical protein